MNGVKTLIGQPAEEAAGLLLDPRLDRSRPARASAVCWLEGHAGVLGDLAVIDMMGGESSRTNSASRQFHVLLDNPALEDGFRKLLGAFDTQRCPNPSISLGLRPKPRSRRRR